MIVNCDLPKQRIFNHVKMTQEPSNYLSEHNLLKKHHFDLTVRERKTLELKVLTWVREINMENLTREIIIGFFLEFSLYVTLQYT